ncbi:hypothetical protein TNCV_3412411 [Trichonephila clavipes]|uniref:Uncharacterized protein n=1 Tax=Trichonephila clavipes TaxID=2585209 RepID=A0A8X6RF63_TRICX|nr:hypothetical protein TNCV_3412411 [Trichonephila clavipes]
MFGDNCMSRSQICTMRLFPVSKSEKCIEENTSSVCRRGEGKNGPLTEGGDTCYSMAFGDEPRHFEPCSSDDDNTRAGTFSPNYRTPPTGGR